MGHFDSIRMVSGCQISDSNEINTVHVHTGGMTAMVLFSSLRACGNKTVRLEYVLEYRELTSLSASCFYDCTSCIALSLYVIKNNTSLIILIIIIFVYYSCGQQN